MTMGRDNYILRGCFVKKLIRYWQLYIFNLLWLVCHMFLSLYWLHWDCIADKWIIHYFMLI